LSDFLSKRSVNKEEFLGAAKWIEKTLLKKMRRDRFWSKENLGTIPSIGTSWGYAKAPELQKFSQSFERKINLNSINLENGFRNKEVNNLERALEESGDANIIIVSDDPDAAKDIIARLLKKIKLGIAFPSVEYKTILELDYISLIASTKQKNIFEEEFIKILNQTEKAKNIILYIHNLPEFILSAKKIGVDVVSILEPYLSSNNISIICDSNVADFHFIIETAPVLQNKFEKIIPEALTPSIISELLLERVPYIEYSENVFFSYPAILAIAELSDRYIVSGEMPDKALDILTEIGPWAKNHNIKIIRESDVSIFMSQKTGVASGPITKGEAEKIVKSEEILRSKIIGQDKAITSIINALRRSRSGISNPHRPIASFLFMGPTGVGKTETSKALAESFFGGESLMNRLDMSEYIGSDALVRLIGDFEDNRQGVLSSKLRDNPYGVLLLDEFEKTSKEVLNLFLQILDEGFFTDAFGKKVNCRNLIIIATSNAGSDIILESIKNGEDLKKTKTKIIDRTFEAGIFKPELINRFDAVIIFSPLQGENLRQVVEMELGKLLERLDKKDIKLKINNTLIDYLLNEGSDVKFGARAIRRAIQDNIESIIADKMINGEITPGEPVEILESDLKK
jgi:ATP-dependent Clp protease ATP-binding subunit ClpC